MWLQLFRIGVLMAAAWLLRDHAVRMRVESLRPVTIGEVRTIFPAAAELRLDTGDRGGWDVLGNDGNKLGYVLQTAPVSDSVIGYRGWTNVLVAFTPELKVAGVKIRASMDTEDHVADVANDRTFMRTWNGQTWEEVAGKTPEEAGIEGVSGASMTSLAIAEGIVRRLRAADAAKAMEPPPLRIAGRDIGLAAVVVMGCVLALRGTAGRPWLRRGFQVLVVIYVGFLNGDLLAQTLFFGWAAHGVPWRTAPGLVLLVVAALVVPWGTGKPLYCQHLCAHGHLQEWIARWGPRRLRIRLSPALQRGLRWLAPLTLGYALIVTLLVLPHDLADIEPFDAYLLGSAGVATITIAILSLLAAFSVPMGYCHHACPTGAMLNFIRSHGSGDRFGRREIAALLLLALAWGLSHAAIPFHAWLQSPAADWL